MIDISVKKRLGAPGKGGFSLDVSFALPENCSRAVLFGPSGSGKTLTLRALSGLLTPDSGRISLCGNKVFDSGAGLNVPARKRRIGFMFQDYALFPHMTVEENVAFGLKGTGKNNIRNTVYELLEFFGIAELGERRPAAISGGQKQRAALARALAVKPYLLLLDEPFSALDPMLRGKLRREFRDMLGQIGLPALIISHDPDDVEAFAEQLVLFDGGRINKVLPGQGLFDGKDPGGVLESVTGCPERVAVHMDNK